MSAFNNIDLAGSCTVTSTEYAEELGVPESKRIYPLGGAGTQDSDNCKGSVTCIHVQHIADEYDHTVWERPNFHSSSSVSRSLNACLDISRSAKEQIDLFDFYSYVDSRSLNIKRRADLKTGVFPLCQSLRANISDSRSRGPQSPSRF